MARKFLFLTIFGILVLLGISYGERIVSFPPEEQEGLISFEEHSLREDIPVPEEYLEENIPEESAVLEPVLKGNRAPTEAEVLSPPSTPSPSIPTPVSIGTINESEIIRLTNAERSQQGLSPLAYNVLLSRMAQKKAQDMIDHQYFAHESPDGVEVGDLAEHEGYEYRYVGENLAVGNFRSNADVITGWMNSEGHRRNILSENFSEIGVGAVFGVFEGARAWMVVQEFGDPLPLCDRPSLYLRERIEFFESELQRLDQTIAFARKKIEETGGKDQKAVDEYNSIVELYNGILEDLRGFITEYNALANAYNACIER